MTPDGSQIIRSIAVPSTNGMVRSDGIWILNQTLTRYSFAGTPIEQIPLDNNLANSSLVAVTPVDPAGGFLLVDEPLNRLVTVSRQGVQPGETPTRMLDADHFGGGRALAVDPVGERMFLLTRTATIFVLAARFLDTDNVSPLLQLTSSAVASSASASPAGPAGSLSISARFENPAGVTICSLFFKVTELTVDRRRGVDQLETVTVTSTGQQLQGFGEQVLGHAPFDLGPRSSQDFSFRVDLGSRRPFNFLVDAWGTPASPGVSCR